MTAEHFIVRHAVVSSKGDLVGGMTFTPSGPRALSSYELPATGTCYATRSCNLNEFWVTEFTA